MKIWIGHFLEEKEKWFLVWGSDKDEAISMVDAAYCEPDVRSMLEIDKPGCIYLSYEIIDLDENEPSYMLIATDEESPIIERRKKPSVEDWVELHIKSPLGPSRVIDTSELALQMKIIQPEVVAAYKINCCPFCSSNSYSRKNGCSACGYRIETDRKRR